MGDRLLLLHVARRQRLEIEAAHVEVAAIALPRQIGRRGRLAEEIIIVQADITLVIEQKVAVRQGGHVPAEFPLVVDRELPDAARLAAPPLVAHPHRRLRKHAGIADMRAFEMDHIIAGLETLTELRGQKRPLLREIGRRDRQIHVGRDRPEKRKADAQSQRADAVVQLGDQKAGLPLFRGVRPRQERKIGDRHSQQLESRVLVIDDLLNLVANDPLGVELPHARLGRIVLAGFAGGVGALVEHRRLAAGPLAARRAEMGVVGRVGLQALDKSVLEIVSEIKHLGMDHRSIRFDQRRVPLRENTPGLAIIDHMVRAQETAIVINPHVAIGRDRVLVLVVDEFLGLDHHARRRRVVRRRGPWPAATRRAAPRPIQP